ncbi:MAG TPA: hypothetical protein VJA40_01505 [archaeon]|nr:hypothetical protein [archaeon]
MSVEVEAAKFLAGVFAWDAFIHASFLASKVEPTVLGMHWTSNKNKAALALNLALFAVLAYFAWSAGA